VPGLMGPAEGTHGCTATEGKAESLSLGAKGYPLMWRSEMSEVRSDDCEGREQRTEEASRQKQEQRMARLVALLVDPSSHSRGGLIRRKEASGGGWMSSLRERYGPSGPVEADGQAATPMATTR
jgi:hypothetical protein